MNESTCSNFKASSADPFEDPFALMEQELTRLEAELRARDEAAARVVEREAELRRGADAQAARIAGLLGELSERDEMIELLQEHARRLEEQIESDQAEWDRLGGWIDRLEERFSTQGDAGAGRACESEGPLVARDEPAAIDGAAEDEANPIAEKTNKRMHAQMDALRSELNAARQEADAARTAVEALEVETRRLRERLATTTAASAASSASGGAGSAVKDGGELSASLRMRALREHLREIEQREEEQRRRRTISARLARLWNGTG